MELVRLALPCLAILAADHLPIQQVIFISTLVYRYDFKLVDDVPTELKVAEGFLRKVRSSLRLPAGDSG